MQTILLKLIEAMKTPEQIAKECEHKNDRANRQAINKVFRAQDDSRLYPINGRFNATNRAIKRAHKFMHDSGHDLTGLEYALFLDNQISEIVNDPRL